MTSIKVKYRPSSIEDKEGVIEDRNPFRHVYTGVDKTTKRALSPRPSAPPRVGGAGGLAWSKRF